MSKNEKYAGEFWKKSGSLVYQQNVKRIIFAWLHNFFTAFFRFYGSIELFYAEF
jgi:hypothetical protein